MVAIAVAGGTGNVGRTIVETLIGNPKNKVIVLARKAPDVQGGKAPVFAVDYSDINGTAKVLESNGVHTVISTMKVMSQEQGTAQVNLVKAAANSTTTKRFITSQWGTQHPEDDPSPRIKYRDEAAIELRKTDMEWTQFYNGYFLDYYGIPHIKTHCDPVAFVMDMANKTAAIPGTGNEIVSLTYTYDLAKFVAAALDLPKWEEKTFCYSDKTTWNEFLTMAEEARAAKFHVTYDSLDKLQQVMYGTL